MGHGGARCTQRGDDLLVRSPAQSQQQEGILVQLIGQQHQDCRNMMADRGPLRAIAVGIDLGAPLREQPHARGAECILDVPRQVPVQQVRRVGDALGHQPDDAIPHVVRKRPEAEAHRTHPAIWLVHARRDAARLHGEVCDLVAPDVQAPRRQKRRAHPVAKRPQPAAGPHGAHRHTAIDAHIVLRVSRWRGQAPRCVPFSHLRWPPRAG